MKFQEFYKKLQNHEVIAITTYPPVMIDENYLQQTVKYVNYPPLKNGKRRRYRRTTFIFKASECQLTSVFK